MATHYFSVLIDIEIEDMDGDEGIMDTTTVELEARIKKYVEDTFGADVIIEAAEGTLNEAFGIEIEE